MVRYVVSFVIPLALLLASIKGYITSRVTARHSNLVFDGSSYGCAVICLKVVRQALQKEAILDEKLLDFSTSQDLPARAATRIVASQRLADKTLQQKSKN